MVALVTGLENHFVSFCIEFSYDFAMQVEVFGLMYLETWSYSKLEAWVVVS